MPDYYDLLEIPRNASIIEIKRAYRRLIRQYHPDVVKQTPETLKKYQELTTAYEVLSDPRERVAYDRKIPKKKYPMTGLAPDALWRETTELVLQKSDRFGPMQQAMRAALGITREGNILVVGMAGQHGYLAGHLQTAGNRHFINDALQEVSGEPLEFRLIEGTTLEDWQVVKQSEDYLVRKAAGRASPPPPVFEPQPRPARPAPGPEPEQEPTPVAQPAAAGARSPAWEELKGRLERTWSHHVVPGQRQSPLSRARFLSEAIPLIRAAEEEALDADEPEETITRQLNRALERVAAATEMPPAMVALEYLRYCQERGF